MNISVLSLPPSVSYKVHVQPYMHHPNAASSSALLLQYHQQTEYFNKQHSAV